MLWEDATMCVLLDRLDLFTRKKEVLEKYNQYCDALNRNGVTVSDVITKKMEGRPIAWMRNEYPYDVDNTRHYLIWSTYQLSNEKIKEIATRHAQGRKFICFVNPEYLRSVKNIWHAHVIINETNIQAHSPSTTLSNQHSYTNSYYLPQKNQRQPTTY